MALFATVVATGLAAQSAATPDLSGAWAPYRGGRGADPKFAAPPATEILLKGDYKKSWDARRAAEAEANKKGEPLATPAVDCIPYGMPRMMSVALYPMEIIQRPAQITIVTEAFSEVRRVYMNQPQLPIDEVPPGYYGHSVGRWEGDTLVIDTVGIKTAIPAYQMMPHSEQMRITERIRLVAPDYLHDQITIEDPVVLEKPVTYTLAYRRMPNYKMVEFVCENNREYVDSNGAVRLRLGQ
ncbi:MAG TPA: hypothetical protein VFD69_20825 [Vicinamibacterales bacterium]|nr:hypothetical protein [Vicinamibacterales bacterium]